MKKDYPYAGLLHTHWPEESKTQTPPTAMEKGLLRMILRIIANPDINVTFWDGESLHPTGKGPCMVLKERAALWRILVHPILHFGDDYSRGHIEVEGDLLPFLEKSYATLDKRQKDTANLLNIFNSYRYLRGNPIERAKDNIHHHCDIGNDFYRLWLDKEMAYTCAYFSPGTTTLEAAQVAKMEHVYRKLRLKPGETVIEAGCGWIAWRAIWRCNMA